MTDPPTRRLMLLADHVHPFVYRSSFPDPEQQIDAVLCAGDLPGYYLEFLATKLTVPIVYVHGNHENEMINEGGQRLPPRGVIPAHGRIVEEVGLRIAGFGGSPRYRKDGHGQYSASEARWGFRRLGWQLGRKPLDILLTHAPPLGPHAGSDYAHRGCPEMTRFMHQKRPHLLVHGHIHEYEGKKTEYVDEQSGTRVINAYGYRVIEVPVRE